MKDIDIITRIRGIFEDRQVGDFVYSARVLDETFACVFISIDDDKEEEDYNNLIELLEWLIKSNNMNEYRLTKKWCETRESSGVMNKHQEYTIYFS